MQNDVIPKYSFNAPPRQSLRRANESSLGLSHGSREAEDPNKTRGACTGKTNGRNFRNTMGRMDHSASSLGL